MKHKIRHKLIPTVDVENYTRNVAIKAMCTECLGWGEEHPKDCTSPLCPLYPYRNKTTISIAMPKRGGE